MSHPFRESIQTALHNPNLSKALGRFSEAYRISRAKAYEGIDFESVRARIVAHKAWAAAHLEELAGEFTRQAEARGAKVFRASGSAAVTDYVLGVARARGIRAVVKSKSMASEEIHLNRHLEAAGIAVSETDLGEWIVQLAGDRPSHMVMPAIHLTKEQVAEIFSHEVNRRLASDIPQLVEVARRELRGKFLAAGLGITGANIAVAETGSLVIVTNEGNARLVTTLPPVHIAIVGVEKLVASFAEIVPILTALPRSATGQLMTSYVTILTGPAPNTDGTAKDLHIVLMDNGRSKMAGDGRFREALQCIRCASCLNVCPVFRLVGGHVFGKTYTGGIGTILTAWFDRLRQADDIQSLCIQCGNCAEVCPGHIDIPGLILELRRRLVAERGQPVVQRAAFSVVNNRPLFHSLLRAASVLQKPVAQQGFIRHLPAFLGDLCEFRSLPAIAAKPFRDRFAAIAQPPGREKAAFFAGCLIDFAYPEIGEAVVKVLNRGGISVVFPAGQTCCGAPARYAGAPQAAAESAAANREALLAGDPAYIVSACPTCTVALKEDPQLAGRAIDFSSLVASLVNRGRLTLASTEDAGPVTYHDSCHLKRTLKASGPPRELLQKAGYRLSEMYESDMCCGMAGSYSLKLPEISAPILERKLENIAASGAPVVATDCPGCALQLRGGLDKAGSLIQVRHTAELL
jgi:iron-sulfur cluster protein